MPAKITITTSVAILLGALALTEIPASSSVIAAQAATHVGKNGDTLKGVPASFYMDSGLRRNDNLRSPSLLLSPQDTGAKLFALTCVTCHKANGLGVPDSVPPLAGSEWATGSPARMLRIVLGGMQGEIEVLGEFFNAAMPGWGGTLNDHDIAAVTTYVRKSWGNKGSAITAETVAQVRKAIVDRKTPWTAEELRKIGG